MSRICLVLVVILFVGASGDDSISCSASSFNGAAEIICHFNTPVNKSTHEAIIISHYPDGYVAGQAGQKTHVLACDLKESGKMQCEEVQGYKRKNETDITKITLTIPNATAIHQGIYTCELVPPKPYTHCHLIIQVSKALEAEVSKESATTKPNISPTTSTSSDNGNGSADTSGAGMTDLEIGLIVFSVFVTTICIIFVVLYCRRRRRAMEKVPETTLLRSTANQGNSDPGHFAEIDEGQAQQATLRESDAPLSESDDPLSESEAIDLRRQPKSKKFSTSSGTETDSSARLLIQKRKPRKRTTSERSQSEKDKQDKKDSATDPHPEDADNDSN